MFFLHSPVSPTFSVESPSGAARWSGASRSRGSGTVCECMPRHGSVDERPHEQPQLAEDGDQVLIGLAGILPFFLFLALGIIDLGKALGYKNEPIANGRPALPSGLGTWRSATE